jgi:hypothetical protein
MNAKPRTFDLAVAQEAVELDVAGALAQYFEGELSLDRALGQATWRSDGSEFFAVRWRFSGKHTGRIPGFGNTYIEPTKNAVSVSGLTLVENTTPDQPVGDDLDALLRNRTVVFQRYIDWLAVFAQLGVLHLGRPMSISNIRFEAPQRGTRRRPGYNDEQGDA